MDSFDEFEDGPCEQTLSLTDIRNMLTTLRKYGYTTHQFTKDPTEEEASFIDGCCHMLKYALEAEYDHAVQVSGEPIRVGKPNRYFFKIHSTNPHFAPPEEVSAKPFVNIEGIYDAIRNVRSDGRDILMVNFRETPHTQPGQEPGNVFGIGEILSAYDVAIQQLAAKLLPGTTVSVRHLTGSQVDEPADHLEYFEIKKLD